MYKINREKNQIKFLEIRNIFWAITFITFIISSKFLYTNKMTSCSYFFCHKNHITLLHYILMKFYIFLILNIFKIHIDDGETDWKIVCVTKKLLSIHHQFIILKFITEYQSLNISKEIKILTNCININDVYN